MSLRLNIACATNIFPGWTNTDRDDVEQTYLKHLRGLAPDQMHGWSDEQKQHVEALNAGKIQFFQWDLRKGFPMYPDGSVEAAYIGQAVEHLNFTSELPALLKECHRVLAPGGRIRITTPDLLKLLAAYRDGTLMRFADEQPEMYRSASPEVQLSMIMFGASGAGCTSENYEGHFMCLAPNDLGALLRRAGFVDVAEMVTPSPAFKGVIDKGLSHSMAVEARKP